MKLSYILFIYFLSLQLTQSQPLLPVTPIGHTKAITVAAFSPDERLIATGGEDNSIVLWDIATGVPFKRLMGHTNEIRSLFFLTKDKIISSSADHTFRVWDAAYGIELSSNVVNGELIAMDLVRPKKSNKAILAIGNYRSIELIFVGEEKSKKIVIDTENWDETQTIALSQNGKNIVAGDNAGHLNLWDVETGKLIFTKKVLDGDTTNSQNSQYFKNLKFSQDGLLLLTEQGNQENRGEPNTKVLLWDTNTWKVIHRFPKRKEYKISAFAPHHPIVITQVWEQHPKDNYSSYYEKLKAWNVATGEITKSLLTVDFADKIFFSPTAKYFLTFGEHNRSFILYDYSQFKRIKEFKGNNEIPKNALFLANGEHIAIQTSKAIFLWHWRNDQKPFLFYQRSLGGGHGEIAFDPRQNTLITTGWGDIYDTVLTVNNAFKH